MVNETSTASGSTGPQEGWVDESGKATAGGPTADMSAEAAASGSADAGSKSDATKEADREQEIAEAVTAKIEDLELEKAQADSSEAGKGASADKEGESAVTVTEQSSKEREAVEAALLKEGDDSSNPSAKELLEKGEGGALAAETGTGLGGVAAVPPKHIVPRPAPQKNFNLKL